jgi:hypothetical protein
MPLPAVNVANTVAPAAIERQQSLKNGLPQGLARRATGNGQLAGHSPVSPLIQEDFRSTTPATREPAPPSSGENRRTGAASSPADQRSAQRSAASSAPELIARRISEAEGDQSALVDEHLGAPLTRDVGSSAGMLMLQTICHPEGTWRSDRYAARMTYRGCVALQGRA